MTNHSHPKRLLGNVVGVKVYARNTFSIPLVKRQFRGLCTAVAHAVTALGEFRADGDSPLELRKKYGEIYAVLARLCTNERTRTFEQICMHGLQIEKIDMMNGEMCLSFRYSADGIPDAEYQMHFHDELAPYVENYVKKYEKISGDTKKRQQFELL